MTVRAIEISRAAHGLSRAEALQRAAKEIRDDASHDTAHDSWAHPSAWAPFSLVGDGAK
jgi:CHAT domain-containing protein